jgi:hypothetical protein
MPLNSDRVAQRPVGTLVTDASPALSGVPIVLVLAGTVTIVWLMVYQRITFRQGFLSSMALLAASLAILGALSRRPLLPRAIIATRGELAGFLLLFLVGAAMRTIGMDKFPPHDGQLLEELQTGGAGWDAIVNGSLDSFFPLSMLTAEIGFHFLPGSMTTLRLPFVVFGILSVPLFFVAARLFFRSYAAAFLASGLFATNAFLAGSSRIALESMSPVITECFTLAALFYACVKRAPFAAALAGFATSLSFTEYFSYKLLPVPAAFLLLARWLQGGDAAYCNAVGPAYRWSNLWRAWREMLFAAVFSLAAMATVLASDWHGFSPIFEGYLRHRPGFDQVQLPLVQNLIAAAKRVRDAAKYTFVSGGGIDVLPASMGLTDRLTGCLCVAALAWCALSGRRRPAKLFLVLATILYLVLGGVLVLDPQRYRFIPLIPFACLAVGVIVDDALARFPKRSQVIAAASAALLMVLAALNVHRFFAVAIHDNAVLRAFNYVDATLALGLAAAQKSDPGATIYLFSNRVGLGVPNPTFFLYDYTRVKVVGTVDELAGAHGPLLTHDSFIETVKTIPALEDCQRWESSGFKLMQCRIP